MCHVLSANLPYPVKIHTNQNINFRIAHSWFWCRGWRLTITRRELLLVSQWGFAQEFLLFITILIKLQSPILLPRRQRMGQSADFARWPWAVPTSRIIWRGSILRLLMKFNVSKYSEKFLCSFYWYCYVGLDDEAKSVLVEKQQNDSSHFPRWILSEMIAAM